MNTLAFGFRVVGLVLALCGLFGCQSCDRPETFGTGGDPTLPITRADITYGELAERYNKAAEPFETLWARTDIDIEWYEIDADGDRDYRSESGEGKFMFRRPMRTALTVEKLGKTYLWAGSDDQRYWLFDLVDSERKTVYIGAFEKLSELGGRAFPLPVRPDRVPDLLGLMPLPPAEALGEAPQVDLYDGRYLVQLDGMRLLIDPETFRPTRVDLTDDLGFSVLTSKLEGRFPVEADGVAENKWPTICERAEIYVAGYDSRLTVGMDFATTDPRRLRDQMFSLDALDKALKPDFLQSLDP